MLWKIAQGRSVTWKVKDFSRTPKTREDLLKYTAEEGRPGPSESRNGVELEGEVV